MTRVTIEELIDTLGWLADECDRIQKELPTGQDSEASRAIATARIYVEQYDKGEIDANE